MAKHSEKAQGLMFLMKNPKTNPLTPEGRKGFNAMVNASGLPMGETLKYIGKKSKAPRVSDEDKSQERLQKLQGTD